MNLQPKHMQDDIIEPEELERAAYEYVLKFRDAGERHDPGLRKKGKLIESVVFTREKMAAMGIPEGTVPEGWWIGFKVEDDEAWKKIKSGEYRSFSIEGTGERVPYEGGEIAKTFDQIFSQQGKTSLRLSAGERIIEQKGTIAKTFLECLTKFNPYHDEKGRFSTAGGAISFTFRPGASVAHDNAIAREKVRTKQEREKPEPLSYGDARQKVRELNAEYKKTYSEKRELLVQATRANLDGDKMAYDKAMEERDSKDKRMLEIRTEISETAKSAGIESGVGIQLLGSNIEYREVNQLDKPLNSDEIVSRLGGGDKTKGSCSSLAFAYAGNENGLDVLDFRGGESQYTFSLNSNIYDIANLPGVKSVTADHTNDFKSASVVLEKAKSGKSYYFATGKHAAIVRRSENGLEYLELQSSYDNGFKPLTNERLKNRFGAQKSHTVAGSKFESKSVLIDVASLKGNKEFEHLLGYINTSNKAQRKGKDGHEK